LENCNLAHETNYLWGLVGIEDFKLNNVADKSDLLILKMQKTDLTLI